jgi:hypothetical protein
LVYSKGCYIDATICTAVDQALLWVERQIADLQRELPCPRFISEVLGKDVSGRDNERASPAIEDKSRAVMLDRRRTDYAMRTAPIEPRDVLAGPVMQPADEGPRRDFLLFLVAQAV